MWFGRMVESHDQEKCSYILLDDLLCKEKPIVLYWVECWLLRHFSVYDLFLNEDFRHMSGKSKIGNIGKYMGMLDGLIKQ